MKTKAIKFNGSTTIVLRDDGTTTLDAGRGEKVQTARWTAQGYKLNERAGNYPTTAWFRHFTFDDDGIVERRVA